MILTVCVIEGVSRKGAKEQRRKVSSRPTENRGCCFYVEMHFEREKSLLLRRQSFQPKGANEQRKWGSKLIGIV
jgi:hypothetical protein